MKILLRIAGFLMILALVGGLALAGFTLTLLPDLPSAKKIRDVKLQVPLRVYASNGKLLAVFGEQRREPVSIDKVPKTLIHAILAAEDDSFYSHPGVDFEGVVRAAIKNFESGQVDQGASTITMQVARNYFLSREKTYTRKIKEALLAFKLERMFTKDQILELYINKIFLGQRAYGFGAAARIYYGKPLDKLTLAETAVLAGLPKAPSRDNPITSPRRAKIRRDYVLTRMHKLHYIDDATYQAAMHAPLTAEPHRIATDEEAPYVAEMVRDYMVNKYGDKAYWGGYKVYTTVVPRLQAEADRALRAGLLAYSHRHGYRGPVAHIKLTQDTGSKQLDDALAPYRASGNLLPAVVIAVDDKKQTATAYTRSDGVVEIPWQGLEWARPYESPTRLGAEPKKPSDVVSLGDVVYVSRDGKSGWQLNQVPKVEGGLVSLDPNDGAILALTGGFDFYLGKFNRVTQAKRQPGSNIKPFIFSAAMEHGFTTATRVSGGPIVVKNQAQDAVWRPENYSGKFFGPTRLRKALMESLNLVSIRLVRSMGVDVVRNYISRFGFDPKSLPNGLSLALGSATIPPMTVARAYAVLANGGFLVKPYFMKWIEDSDGNIIEQAQPALACSYCSAPSYETDPDHPLQAKRVIGPANRFLVTSMMRSVIRGGTGRGALTLNRDDLAGKTGTTNDFRDAWFSGFDDKVETTVWVGFDDSSTLGRSETGARAALPIWIDYMRTALKGVPESPLPQPDDVVTAHISPDTGKVVPDDDADGMTEYFKVGTVPKAAPAGNGGASNGSAGTGAGTQGLF